MNLAKPSIVDSPPRVLTEEQKRMAIETAKRTAFWEAWKRGELADLKVSADAVSRFCRGVVIQTHNDKGLPIHIFVWPGWRFPIRNRRGEFIGYARVKADAELMHAMNRVWDRILGVLDPASKEHPGRVD